MDIETHRENLFKIIELCRTKTPSGDFTIEEKKTVDSLYRLIYDDKEIELADLRVNQFYADILQKYKDMVS